MIVNILLLIACSLDPQGSFCQAFGGPCAVNIGPCSSSPQRPSRVINDLGPDAIYDRKQR